MRGSHSFPMILVHCFNPRLFLLIFLRSYFSRTGPTPTSPSNMPCAPPSPKSKPKVESPTDGDHRKRRRNRTTQACLNCHATKRMCDRKRPCSRCSQLGLTGNCVYEVDDPSRQGKQDEESRMKSRIAELEGVIREMKNKPHPRWLAEKGSKTTGAAEEIHFALHASEGYSPPNGLPWAFPAAPPLANFPASVPPTTQFSFVAHERRDSVESLLSMCSSEHTIYSRRGSPAAPCGCLAEAECYNAGLELSIRLRRAAEALARSQSHASNPHCALAALVSELDVLVKDSLLNAVPGALDPPYPHIPAPFPWDLDNMAGTPFYDDYLSWLPSRPNSL
ncbi:hypothetical protein C8R46DRAFT_1340777 [Mycena filopes]|nr:hypothetical protein C8R46DRAFT_1340777 [Mycena filopes]